MSKDQIESLFAEAIRRGSAASEQIIAILTASHDARDGKPMTAEQKADVALQMAPHAIIMADAFAALMVAAAHEAAGFGAKPANGEAN